MGKAYEQCPIVCRLTDFGLSRSIDLQTKSVTMSKTTSMYCGTPAYMAPEMQLNQLDFASLDDLKRSDMWSLGLVVHTMTNPELGSPYQAEIEQTGVLDVKEAVKKRSSISALILMQWLDLPQQRCCVLFGKACWTVFIAYP